MNKEDLINKIREIISLTDSDMDRLPSQWDQLRVEAYEKIRNLFGLEDYIPFMNKN